MKINPNGFREYDARWIFEKDIDIEGITNLGKGLGTQIIGHTKKINPRVTVGHDYRSYSEKIKKALTEGLMSTGCNVEDIGLSLSPMVYFAQFNLNSDAIAMVTASHNENGWTGVKMGIQKGLTHAPEEMANLKDITLNKKFLNGDGSFKKIDDFNTKKIIQSFDIIIDGTDNFSSKFLINKFSKILKKVLISGAIGKFDGHIFGFNFSKKTKPCLESFYQGTPDDDLATCEEDGVIGTVAGIVGNIQANEAIKYILDVGKCLNGKVLIINLLNLEFRICDLI